MTDQHAIYDEVSALLVKLFEIDPQDIKPEARLYEDLELDSIDAVDMIVHLQKKTGKKIKPEEFKAVRTVQDVVDAVERLLKEACFAVSGVRTLPVLTGVLLLAWPFLIWFGLAHHSLQWLLPLMALLLFLRFRQTRRQAGPLRVVTQVVAAVGITLCIASYLLKTHQLLLFYPVVVNAVRLAVFGGSLWSSMPIVERLARLRDPQLPDAAVRYTRRVTQIWCAFFIFNGGVALFTALHGDMAMWTAWNGMIAYLLMGLLMGSEWLIRRRMINRDLQ